MQPLDHCHRNSSAGLSAGSTMPLSATTTEEAAAETSCRKGTKAKTPAEAPKEATKAARRPWPSRGRRSR